MQSSRSSIRRIAAAWASRALGVSNRSDHDKSPPKKYDLRGGDRLSSQTRSHHPSPSGANLIDLQSRTPSAFSGCALVLPCPGRAEDVFQEEARSDAWQKSVPPSSSRARRKHMGRTTRLETGKEPTRTNMRPGCVLDGFVPASTGRRRSRREIAPARAA